MRFWVFAKNALFGFGEKVHFYWFGRKVCSYENICFTFFAEKRILRFWRESVCFQFLRENVFFLVLAEKYICKKIEFKV